ncbi:MAG: caspase domain-containing protein [Steroidobacterales bacterium]
MRIGHRKPWVIAIAAALLLPGIAAAQLTDADLKRMRADKRVALVIGNGNYRSFQQLDNPVNDAKGVAAALREAGFEVILRLDATREDMSQALDQFDQALSKADIGLFYFAGHAAQVDWHNFMVPISANLDLSAAAANNLVGQVAQETVDLGDVLDRMGRADKKLNIVILDACRDNPFTEKALELSRSLSRSTGQTPIKVGVGLVQSFAPPRTFLAYATAPGQVASDGTGKDSPYSAALIQALAVPGLKLEDVFKRVRNSVAEATHSAQIPWDNSSVFDDFYFRIPTAAELAKSPAKKGEINTTFVSP